VLVRSFIISTRICQTGLANVERLYCTEPPSVINTYGVPVPEAEPCGSTKSTHHE
jgi:hypothetical protein